MAEHSTLTGASLHEPKGVAEATAGKLYVSDGEGSGSWKYLPQGYGFYKGTDAEQTFSTVATKLTINGSGGITDTSNLPLEIRGVSQLWDTTNNLITPVAENDSYILRFDLPITSRATARYINVVLDIGGGVTPTIPIVTTRIEVDRTAPFSHSFLLDAFVGSTFIVNGGQIFLNTDAGTIGITEPAIKVTRTYGDM